MTSIREESSPLEEVHDNDDDCHVVCCEDDDLALCGFDVSNMDWGDGNDSICTVCRKLLGDLSEECESTCPARAVQLFLQ